MLSTNLFNINRTSIPFLRSCVRFSSNSAESIESINSLYDSTKLNDWSSVSISSQPTLFTTIRKTPHIPVKHGYLVANVTFSGYMPDHLDTMTYFARYMGASAKLALSDPIHLPHSMQKWHMNRGPFAHGKTMDVFEKKTFHRLVQVFDAPVDGVKMWTDYIKESLPAGIDMKVEFFEWKKLGFGKEIVIPSDIPRRLSHVEQVKRTASKLLKEFSSKK